jgi:hypothetical protein
VIVIANNSVNASGVSKDDLKDDFTGSAITLKDGSRWCPSCLKRTGDLFCWDPEVGRR